MKLFAQFALAVAIATPAYSNTIPCCYNGEVKPRPHIEGAPLYYLLGRSHYPQGPHYDETYRPVPFAFCSLEECEAARKNIFHLRDRINGINGTWAENLCR